MNRNVTDEGKPVEIWVADDSNRDLEAAQSALSADYHLRAFSDGSQVVEELSRSARPAVLVLDWVMPGMSGIEVLQFLRSARGMPQLPVLLLTAHGTTEQIVEGLAAGANDYLAKPYAPEELRARISVLVRMKRLNDRLTRAESDLRAVLASTPDALLAVDAQAKITYANDEASRVFGRPAAALLGERIDVLAPSLSTRSIALGGGDPLFPVPDVAIGDRVFAPRFRILPSDDASSTTISLRDITERRRAEMRRLDFYSIIAHDLRTPLAALLMRSQILLSGRRGLLPAEVTADVQKIERSIRQLVGMINDFLDLARLEGAGFKINRERLDLTGTTRRVIDEFRPLVDASHLRIKVDATESLMVEGDVQRLTQVISNLLGNAIKFTPADGEIAVKVSRVEDWVDLRVRDTGRGIASDALPNLFQRYNRALDESHGIAGTGLGLMIVREIVEAHGGVVGVESQEGVGSVFWFRLPRAPDLLGGDERPAVRPGALA